MRMNVRRNGCTQREGQFHIEIIGSTVIALAYLYQFKVQLTRMQVARQLRLHKSTRFLTALGA